MRWRVGTAIGVVFATAVASAHWWGAQEIKYMVGTLLGGAVLFAMLVAGEYRKEDPGSSS